MVRSDMEGAPANEVNHAELLVDGHRLLPVLLDDIANARVAIHVSVFLFFRDPIGEEIADALIERARSGVRVRVLLNMAKTALGDPFSTGEKEMMRHDPNVDYDPMDVEPLCKRMREAGVEVIDSNIDYDATSHIPDARLASVASQIKDTIDIDDLHVDHRKLIVIDGHIGYSGGANIGAQYLFHIPFDPEKESRQEGKERAEAGLPEPWWKWHDSLTRFEGPIAVALDHAFHERFVLDGGTDFAPVPSTPNGRTPRGLAVHDARLYCNAPNDQPNEVLALYLRLIREATRSIFIENPYFYHPTLVEALCAAKHARPELDVVVIVPTVSLNDNAYAQDAHEHYYATYLECGIRVFEYQRHFNHLKMAVFDERWSIHGSTNLNYRSLEDDKDFELVVLVDDEPFAKKILAEVRDVDITRSNAITAADVKGSFDALRKRVRDPRTLLLLSRKVL